MSTTRHSLAIAFAAIAFAAGAAAQPAATDLGPLTLGTPVNLTNIDIQPMGVVWFTFSVASDVAQPAYLDIDTEGSALAPSNDTEVGIYDSLGNLRASDDDDGSGLMSALSFGATFPTRPATGTGVAFNGRDGTLLAGTYYLSVSGFNTTFGATNWTVTSTSGNTGPAALNMRYDTVPPPPPGTYVETGDAGDLPGSAQDATGQTGDLNAIIGALSSGTDADMYAIEVCDSAAFSATTVGGATFDTQLWMFQPSGVGVVLNDDEVGGTTLQSRITNTFVTTNGIYLLAVSGYDRDPQDASAQALWLDLPFRSERAPDGPGAANPVASWAISGASGSYRIDLTGACFLGGPDCPGDLNNDGQVSLADLTILLANFGSLSATPEQGDLNGDMQVSLADLTILLANFGTICS